MGLHRAYIGQLVIPSGTKPSNILSSPNLAMARSIVFENAESALTGTVTLQGSHKDEAVAADMVNVELNGSDVTVAAGKVQQYDVNPGRSIRVNSGSNEAADRTIEVFAVLSLAD